MDLSNIDPKWLMLGGLGAIAGILMLRGGSDQQPAPVQAVPISPYGADPYMPYGGLGGYGSYDVAGQIGQPPVTVNVNSNYQPNGAPPPSSQGNGSGSGSGSGSGAAGKNLGKLRYAAGGGDLAYRWTPGHGNYISVPGTKGRSIPKKVEQGKGNWSFVEVDPGKGNWLRQ